MKKNVRQRLSALLLAFALVLSLCPAALAVSSADEKVLIDQSAQWQYLDDGTDPAGDPNDAGYNRTSWTEAGFDDSRWTTASGSFGSKRGGAALQTGYTANTLLNGCDGSSDTPAYFFRTTFTVGSLEGMTKLKGTLQYDDGAIVYLNGQRIAAFDDNACDADGNSLNKGFDANLQYGGSNGGTPKTVSFELLDLSILHTGENTIAVELHNGRATSSDVWFHLTGLSLSDEEVAYQSNISLSMGADQSQMNITWYSPLAGAELTVADNAAMTGAQTVTATASSANDGQYSCKATLTGLQANTTYYYQLNNNNNLSEVYSFTTGGTGAFSFAFVGDPQIGAGNTVSDTAGWDNTLKIIDTNDIFSGVSFLMSAGDQVNTAADENQYDGYLEHDVLTGLPVATAIGNHDSSSNAYSQHFNVPNESADCGKTAAGGDYYFVYNNALFMVLNSNNQTVDEHKTFMQAAIEATKDAGIQWKIVMFHHTLFTVASHAHDGYITDENGFKAQIIPVLKELDVDVVLQGHDHVYCRTYLMDGTTPIKESDKYEYGNGANQAPTAVNDPTGILYVTANSGSGSKTYGILNETFDFSAVQNQESAANVSKVTVSDKQFTITTYRTRDMTEVDSFTIQRTVEPETAGLQINHVYGAYGKDETPISNSFIELYNPTANDIELGGYSIVVDNQSADTTDFTVTFPENAKIKANSSYLIVGAENTAYDAFLTYDLPEADQTDSTLLIDNKKYTIKLMNGEMEEDTFAATGSDPTKISKQKSLKRDGDRFKVVVWEKNNSAGVTIDEAYVTANAPRNSKGAYGSVHSAGASEPVYTPVTASDNRITGYYDSTCSLKLELAGRYNSGAMNPDGGSLEIVQYNPANGYAYAVNGVKGVLTAVNMKGSLDGDKVVSLSDKEYDLSKENFGIADFAYGDMTSVAISPDGTKLAAAIQAESYTDQGVAALFSCKADGSLELISAVKVGVQPDMVTFADNSTILTADEGEPRNGKNGADPKGSVTIVTIGDHDTLTANTVFFDSFDDRRGELTDDGVLVQKDKNPSTDFEPEYIAVSGNTAYVSLQEANAIAVLNIAEGSFTGVYPLGFQDYGKTKLDLQKNGTTEIKNYENVLGIKMPDGISVVSIGSKTYLLTANEGDSRADWAEMDNEYENTTSPTGNVTLDNKVVWFNTTMWDGLSTDKAYVFGGRSFSIYEVTASGLTLTYDSGSDFEEITAEKLADYFNCSNDKISQDNRSGKKGPEPESVVTGEVNGKTYAFIALERIGGVMVYDITDPANAGFVNYINSREFDNAIQGDVSPEGLCFIPKGDSNTGNALLLAACEVSGTLAAYELTEKQSDTATYPVTVDSVQNGSVIVTPKDAGKGDTVTITVKPDSGYKLESLTVTDKDGNAMKLTKGDGKYTFVMPVGEVTVKAAFTKIADVNAFVDVPGDAYYKTAVVWAVENGITVGTSATTFSPNAACTRAQAVTFLWRAAGSPAPKSNVNPFDDVKVGTYYCDAVLWAVENGITLGTSAATFSPNAACTRAQAVTFQWRAEDATASTAANSFMDVSDDAYYANSVLWAVSHGITNGTSAATFSPDAFCTRGQMVTFLYRYQVEPLAP